MKKLFNRFIVFFILILFAVMAVSVPDASALSFDCPVETYSQSIYMVNLDSGIVVYEKDPEVIRMPAGLTKIMTFVLASEYFDNYNETIEIKKMLLQYIEDEGLVTSGLNGHGGEQLPVLDILYNLIMTTGNDSALVLADHIGGGNLDNFVSMMNEKAKKLEMKDTNFTNVLGTDDLNQYTTCVDLYKLTKYAMTLSMFTKIASTATYTITGDSDPIYTTNYIVDPSRGGDYSYVYATGIKNAGSYGAGRCLVSTATYEGYTYMIVAMGAPYEPMEEEDEEWCMIEAANLFRWAFLNLQFVTQATRTTPICEQKVDHAWNIQSILLVPEKDLNIVLPADYNNAEINISPDNEGSISAPIGKGDFVTTATVSYKGEPFMKINLVANEDVQLSPILYVTDIIKSILTSVWFLIAVALIVILFVIYVAISQNYAKKKDKARRGKIR